MTPDKIQQIGDDLARLAASISEIAAELKSIGHFDHGIGEESDEPEPQVEAPDREKPKQPTLEEVRGILADRASNGHREAVQGLQSSWCRTASGSNIARTRKSTTAAFSLTGHSFRMR